MVNNSELRIELSTDNNVPAANWNGMKDIKSIQFRIFPGGVWSGVYPNQLVGAKREHFSSIVEFTARRPLDVNTTIALQDTSRS